MSNKAPIIIEKIWLIIAVSTFIMYLYEVYKNVSISESYPLLIITFVSLIMFFLRRFVRKNNNKNATD